MTAHFAEECFVAQVGLSIQFVPNVPEYKTCSPLGGP